MVNAAFALELYLKCLIQIDTGKLPRSTHEYDKFFKLLPASTGKEIQAAFDMPPSTNRVGHKYDTRASGQNLTLGTQARDVRSRSIAVVQDRLAYRKALIPNPPISQ